MPRSKVEKVVEHRLTLGNFERQALSKQLKEDDVIKKVQTGAEIGKVVMIGGAVAGLGTLAIGAYREAHNLVEAVEGINASKWDIFWNVLSPAFMPPEKMAANARARNQKEQEGGILDKNLGVLEWGFDWLMTFLLGDDKSWTQTTVVTEDEIINGDFDTPMYQDKDWIPGGGAGPRTPWQDFWIQTYGSWEGYNEEAAISIWQQWGRD